jgi:hypothetical protein
LFSLPPEKRKNAELGLHSETGEQMADFFSLAGQVVGILGLLHATRILSDLLLTLSRHVRHEVRAFVASIYEWRLEATRWREALIRDFDGGRPTVVSGNPPKEPPADELTVRGALGADAGSPLYPDEGTVE